MGQDALSSLENARRHRCDGRRLARVRLRRAVPRRRSRVRVDRGMLGGAARLPRRRRAARARVARHLRALREASAIVMTNPDMLSASILPHHPKWARMFQGLEFVVLDELHTYRGVFGSHMAHVLARLVRVARFHGANPTFLCATATIGNPRE